MARPRLLYISPVIPALHGNGLAMRSGAVLEALAAVADVSVLVTPLYPSPVATLPPALNELCEGFDVLSSTGRARSRHRFPWSRSGRTAYRADRFDIVHVFRTATLVPAIDCLGPLETWPARHLDLDDIQSVAARGVAALLRANGRELDARAEEARADRHQTEERTLLSRFDRVYVCSRQDLDHLTRLTSSEVCVLPNTVRVARVRPPLCRAGPLTLLLVGTLNYYPNVDALRFLCASVLPHLRRQEPDVQVVAVGAIATPEVRDLCGHCGIELVENPPSVDPFYRSAHVALVPVRAGGGTRIKVLEAFAQGVPVVSTTIGVGGIDARHAEHYLRADTPDEFVAACLHLRDREGAEQLAGRAFSLVRGAYSTAAARDAVAAAYRLQPRSKL